MWTIEAYLVQVNPVRARWVRLAPAREVVPLVVDAHAQLPSVFFFLQLRMCSLYIQCVPAGCA